MIPKRGKEYAALASGRLLPLLALMLLLIGTYVYVVAANSLFEPDSYLQLVAVYESSGSSLPNPASLSGPLERELVRAADGNMLITSGASADGQYDMQFFRMQLDAALSWGDVEYFGFTWTGHGDAVQGYPVSFHIWDFNAESWVQLGGDEYVPADSSVSRSATLTPANLDRDNTIWVGVSAMHYECVAEGEACSEHSDCCSGMICEENVCTAPPLEATHVTAGGFHTCGVRAGDGRVLCWGRNNPDGQVGDGSINDRRVPTLTADDSAYTGISAGGLHTCGMRYDGRVLCWGNNDYGRLGDGSADDRRVPTLTADASAYASVSAGASHTCGIRDDGRVLCWGRNNYGQVGDNTLLNKYTPTLTTDTSAYTRISAGTQYSCGVRYDGRVLCWGRNNYGQLGDSTISDRHTPRLTSDDSAYTRISAGASHTCGMRYDGRVLCWGRNNYGQVGDSTTSTRYSPTLISDDLAYTSISAGAYHTCGVRDDGRVLCWGRNINGQLGDGSADEHHEPALTSDASAYTQISAGNSHTCGIRYDGRVLCWGYNGQGQIGDGTSGENRLVPTLVV